MRHALGTPAVLAGVAASVCRCECGWQSRSRPRSHQPAWQHYKRHWHLSERGSSKASGLGEPLRPLAASYFPGRSPASPADPALLVARARACVATAGRARASVATAGAAAATAGAAAEVGPVPPPLCAAWSLAAADVASPTNDLLLFVPSNEVIFGTAVAPPWYSMMTSIRS